MDKFDYRKIVYSTVSNKRPGRLLVFSIFAFGTVKISGTVNIFHPFLAFGTFNKYSLSWYAY